MEVHVIHVCFYMGLFLLTLKVIAFSYDLSWLEILFVGTGGYAAEHIAFAIARIIQAVTGWTADRIGSVKEYLIFRLLIYIITAGVIYFVLVRRNREKEEFSLLGNIICPMYSRLCCFLVLMIEYYVFRENRLSRDNEMMEQC